MIYKFHIITQEQRAFLENTVTARLYMDFNKYNMLDIILKRGTYNNEQEQQLLNNLRETYIHNYPKFKSKK